MPSLKAAFGLRKHTQSKDQERPTSIVNAFSALSILNDEQDELEPGRLPQKEQVTCETSVVSEVAAKVSGITTMETNGASETDGTWSDPRTTRRYRHNGTAATKRASAIPEGNWNGHKTTTGGHGRTTYIGKSVRRGPTSAYSTKSKFFRGPKTRSGVAFAQQNPGVITWHWDYRPLLNRNISEEDPARKNVVTAPDGSLWLKKGRFWIIVARTKYAVTEVPIYSYDDLGLEKKLEEVKWEYMSVLARKLVEGKAFVNQSPDNPVLDIAEMRNPDEEMRATMVARYTEAITRDVDADDLRYVGSLSYAATGVLVNKAKEHLGRAPEDH